MNSLLLILLAALWGFSFIFMRIVVPHLGPIPLMFLRVLLAGLVLLPFVGKNQGWALWRKNWRPIMIVGALITAIPFSLMAWVSLSLPAGVTSILGATTPLMVAI